MRRHPEAIQARKARGEPPLFNEEALRLRVERGIRYYDLVHPDWDEKVDIERLRMNTPTTCIRAHVEGIFADRIRRSPDNKVFFENIEDLLNEHFGWDETRHKLEYEHGLTAGFYPTFWERIEEFDYLDRYWKDEVIRRQRKRNRHIRIIL